MEAIRFIFDLAKQVYGPNSMKIMLVDEKRSDNQVRGPMNINIADSLFTFIMVWDPFYRFFLFFELFIWNRPEQNSNHKLFYQ